jgi:cytochrome c oxidase assembly protein subunit 15
MSQESQSVVSPWPHRLAIALALVTYPLIWVGGLVTTYDAGMAVPDWPGTFGYNLLLYPWQSWIVGPFDLFIEHGHRLLGAAAGLLSIALMVVVVVTDRRPWLVTASIGALALVILQGVLGGARVLFDERLIAMIHGCVGPLFFGYLAGLVVLTSRWSYRINSLPAPDSKTVRMTWTIAALAYVQLVLGALVRHVPLSAAPGVFRIALWFHLVVAVALAVHIAVTSVRIWRLHRAVQGLRVPGGLLGVLVVGQVTLGIATYVVKYGFPAWLSDYPLFAGFVVEEKSLVQSLVATAHVANGSLILFVSVLLATRASRLGVGFNRQSPAVLPNASSSAFSSVLRTATIA